MEIHNVEQGTPEWLALRKGKMTASHACEIGNNGKGLDTYILTILSENYSSGERTYYVNADMERGTELEELAVAMYELENGIKTEKVGFIEHNEYVGCSPDRLVGEDGGMEVKCPNDLNYFKMLLNGALEIDSKYIWQIQMNLLISGRKWWDFVAYNPNFEKSLIIVRIYPDLVKHQALLQGFAAGENQIKALKSKLKF